MRQKGFAPILIILIALVAVAGAYYLGTKKGNNLLSPAQSPSSDATDLPNQVTPTSKPTPDLTANWKIYTIGLVNLNFKYPSDKAVFANINSLAELNAEKEYWVAYEGSDQIFLDISLYKSAKNPIDWWNTDGKSKFDKLADALGKLSNPPTNIVLTYESKSIAVGDKEALAITIHSNYETQHTPKINNLVIFQNMGYIITAAYHEFSESSLSQSEQILSTFKFTQ